MKKQVCILTKSLKDHEYCVAGIDMFSSNWVRLVNSADGDACPKEFLDDKNIKILDIVEVEFKSAVPYHVQKENWLIDENVPVQQMGSLKLSQLTYSHPLDKPEFIFGSKGNELENAEVKKLNHSLEFLEVKNLILDTSLKGDGRHHYKVGFIYKGQNYNLYLTDPEYRNEDFDGIRIPNAKVVVSIPPMPYGENDLFYKFVAKIFT